MNLEVQMQGALLGLALGDALGAPLGFMSQEQIQIKHGRVHTMLGGGWLGLRPGQYTSQTKLMLAMAESLLANQGLVPTDVVQRYLAWYRTQPRDLDPPTRGALLLLDAGHILKGIAAEAHEAAGGQSADSGTLARAVPLALYYYQETEQLIKSTLEDAALTHHDQRAGSAAVALNLALACILRGERDKRQILRQVHELLDTNTAVAYNILPEVAIKKQEQLLPSTKAVDTLEVALWGWLKTKNFSEALIKIVNLGGNTSTTGAVGGALAGAYYGIAELPDEWLQVLQDKNIIAQLARRFAQRQQERTSADPSC